MNQNIRYTAAVSSMKYIFHLFAIVAAGAFTACGSTIKTAQDFTPNKPPVIASDPEVICVSDPAPSDGKLYQGLRYRILVAAVDPENAPLTYVFSSSYGSFTGQKTTAGGESVTFIVGTIGAGQKVAVNVRVTDPKKSSVTADIDMGSGKLGPTLTITAPNDVVGADGTTSASFVSNSVGVYEVSCDNGKTIDAVSMTGSNMIDYPTANTDTAISVSGPESSAKSDVRLTSKNISNKVWIAFRDKLGNTVAGGFEIYADGDNPRVQSASPANGASRNCRPAFHFSKKIDPVSITSSVTMSSSDGSVSGTTSLDTDGATILFIPDSPLGYDTAYTVKITGGAAGVSDTSGNRMTFDYAYSFTTAPEGTVSSVTADPMPGTFDSPQSVSLIADPGSSIRYTTDGTAPSAYNGIDYKSPITISFNTVIKAYAFRAGSVNSPASSAYFAVRSEKPSLYIVSGNTATAGGNLSGPTQIELRCNDANALIRYTTDGTDPTRSTPPKSLRFTVSKNTTVKAISYRADLADSRELTAVFTVQTAAPVITQIVTDNGDGTATLRVYMSSSTPGAIIRYTTNGADPGPSSSVYTAPLVYNAAYSGTIKAYAELEGAGPSATSPLAVSFSPTAIQSPVIHVTGSASLNDPMSYDYEGVVSFTSPSSGAEIYYTTDGTNPTSSSSRFAATGPFVIRQTATVKAIAIKTYGGQPYQSGVSSSAVTVNRYYMYAAIATGSANDAVRVYRISGSGALNPVTVLTLPTTVARQASFHEGYLIVSLVNPNAISIMKIDSKTGGLGTGSIVYPGNSYPAYFGINAGYLYSMGYNPTYVISTMKWTGTTFNTPSSTITATALPHTVFFDNTNSYAYVVMHNSSTVNRFAISSSNGSLSGATPVTFNNAANSAANLVRGITVDVGGITRYYLSSLTGICYGTLSEISTASSHKAVASGMTDMMAMHPSKKYLYATTDGASIVRFPVSSSGDLSAGTTITMTGGIESYPIAIDPQGSFIFVGDKAAEKIRIISHTESSGAAQDIHTSDVTLDGQPTWLEIVKFND